VLQSVPTLTVIAKVIAGKPIRTVDLYLDDACV